MTPSIEEIVQDVRNQIADGISGLHASRMCAELIREGVFDSYGSPAKQRGENLTSPQMRAMQTDRGHGEENS